MRPHGSPAVLERRRRRGVALLQAGQPPAEVARRLDCSISSVLRWREAHAAGGDAALAALPVPGRPRKLGEAERERLWKILLGGARAYGFPNDLWTLKRMARVIRREFRVVLHPGHVWKVLRQAGWSCQVPERRALQRDEEAIARWQRYRWPYIKNGAPARRVPGFSR